MMSETTMRELAEMSLASIAYLRGRRMVLYRSGEEQQPVSGWRSPSSPECSPIPLDEQGDVVPLTSIDSSVIVLGEVDDGFVLAGKVSVATSTGSKKTAYVFGPSIFYVGESNAEAMNRVFSRPVPIRLVVHDSAIASRLLRVVLERTTALEVCRGMESGIIALDGSLRLSNFEPARAHLGDIVSECERSGLVLLGVTKHTKLRPLQRLEGCLYDSPRPSYIDVSDLVRILAPSTIGRSLLVRFSRDGVPLRVDVKSSKPDDKVLSSLMASDVISHGYPDSLRAAHVLSIFSATDEASAKSRLVRTEGAKVLQSFNVRRALLGKLEVTRRN